MDPLRIVGRTPLLTEVAAALDRPGAVITLVGDPGVGKTTIWVELLAGRSAAWMWTARCLQVEAGMGLAMLTDLFATLPETVVDRLPALQRHAVDVVLCREVDQGEGRLGDRLVGMTTLTALRELAASGPVVLGIDDLQWADQTSLDALSFALHRLDEMDISVLATRRPEASARLPRTIEVDVDPLSADATADLVRATAPTTEPSRLTAVVEASGGNPLFAKELARQAATSDHTGQRLPSSLREILRARLAPLPDSARAALVDVAVRGAPALADLRAAQLDVELDEAFRADLLVLDNRRIRFTHPLIAAAVLEAATPAELRAAHRGASEAASDQVIAVRHRLEFEEPGEDLAMDLDAAVKLALRRGDQIGARDLAERALAMSSPDGKPARLHRLMQLEGGLGHETRAVELAETLLENPGTPDAHADALAWIATRITDFDDGIAALHEALAVPGVSLVTREILLLDIAWSRLYSAGRTVESIAFLEGALRTTSNPAADLPALVAELAWHKRVAGMPDDPRLPAAVDAIRAAMAARDGDPPPHADLVLGVSGAIAVLDDRHADAVVPLQEATFAATRTGEVDSWVFYSGLLALREGRLADALSVIAAALDWHGPSTVGFARVALANTWRGDYPAAAEALQIARSRLHEGNAARAVEVDFATGFDALLRRDHQAAWPPLRAAAEETERTQYREPSHPPVLPAAVEAAVAVGEIDEALMLCERLERNSAQLTSRFGSAAAYRCRGVIAEALGQVAEAEACYQRGTDEFAAIEVPLERARGLLAVGSLQRRAGRRRQARHTLEIARAIFADCGALALAGDAEAELRRMGGRVAGSSTN